MKMTRAVALAVCAMNAGPAFAWCSKPSLYETPPDPPAAYHRPDVPYCLRGYSYSRSHTCDQGQLDSYRRDVGEYIDKLNAYLRESSTFAQAAINYANEAQRYATCEADEVNSQHQ